MINDVIVSDLINSLSDNIIPSLNYLESLLDFYETELYIVNNLLLLCTIENHALCRNIIRASIMEWRNFVKAKQDKLICSFSGLDDVIDGRYANKLRRRFFFEGKSIIKRIDITEESGIPELKRSIIQAGIDLEGEIKRLRDLKKKFNECYKKILTNMVEGDIY